MICFLGSVYSFISLNSLLFIFLEELIISQGDLVNIVIVQDI